MDDSIYDVKTTIMFGSPHQWFKRRWFVYLLAAITLSGIAISFTFRPRKEPLSRLVPEETLAYIELEEPLTLAEHLTQTQAWSRLAPLLGWPPNPAGLGFWRQFINVAGFGSENLEMLLTARLALVVTGVDMVGDEITPHVAFLLEPEVPVGEVETWMQAQLKAVADQAYGNWTEETSDYAGRRIHIYRSRIDSHQLVWCRLGQVAVVANQMDAIQLIIDTHDQRRRSLADHDLFQRLRATQPDTAPLFGYLSTQPIAQGLQQSTWPADSSSSQARLLTHALQIFFTAFDISLTYHWQVEEGLVVERYRLLGSPEFHQELGHLLEIQDTTPRSLEFIPRDSKSLTILRLGDPEPFLEKLDAMLSRRLSAISSIALREIIIRLKRTWGLDEQDTIADVIGDEIAVVEGNHAELLFILRARRKAKLAAFIGRYLQQHGASVQTTQAAGLEIYSSTEPTRQSFCFVGETLLIGPMDLVRWAIDARQRGMTLEQAPEIKAMIDQQARGAAEISIRLDRSAEARRLEHLLQRLSSPPVKADQILDQFRSCPPTIRTTRLSAEGLWSETRSPLGEIPFWLSTEDESADEDTDFSDQ